MKTNAYLKNILLLFVFALLSVRLAAQDKIMFVTEGLNWHALQSKFLTIKATSGEDFIILWNDGSIETRTGQGDTLIDLTPANGTMTQAGTVTISAATASCRFTYFSCIGNSYFGGPSGGNPTIYYDRPMTALTLTDCSALMHLDCAINQLTALDLSSCTNLTYLDCYNNQLTDLNLSSYVNLTSIRCYNNKLTALDLSSCPNLSYLNCSSNQLIDLELSNCTNLTYLDCGVNQLTNLDLSNCIYLTKIHCFDNQLTDLDFSGCPSLLSLNCSNNQLTDLDLNSIPDLTALNCSGNRLTNLDLNSCPNLSYLHCENNQLTDLDLNSVPDLTELNCSGNQLTNLDLNSCPNLIKIYCGNNQLTDLDLNSVSDLKVLNCSENQLSDLDLSSYPNLSYLDCSNNQLTSLYLNPDHCTRSEVRCYANHLQLTYLYVIQYYGFIGYFGHQSLLPHAVYIGDMLFVEQSVLDTVFTEYTVMQNDSPANPTDYTVFEGKLKFNTEGVYTVKMTNEAIKSNSDYPAEVVVEIEVKDGAGIFESNIPHVKVYPNPTSNMFFVEYEDIDVVKLYDMLGREVLSKTVSYIR